MDAGGPVVKFINPGVPTVLVRFGAWDGPGCRSLVIGTPINPWRTLGTLHDDLLIAVELGVWYLL